MIFIAHLRAQRCSYFVVGIFKRWREEPSLKLHQHVDRYTPRHNNSFYDSLRILMCFGAATIFPLKTAFSASHARYAFLLPLNMTQLVNSFSECA